MSVQAKVQVGLSQIFPAAGFGHPGCEDFWDDLVSVCLNNEASRT